MLDTYRVTVWEHQPSRLPDGSIACGPDEIATIRGFFGIYGAWRLAHLLGAQYRRVTVRLLGAGVKQ